MTDYIINPWEIIRMRLKRHSHTRLRSVDPAYVMFIEADIWPHRRNKCDYILTIITTL